MTGQQGKRQKGSTSCSQTANESGDQERGMEGLPIEVIGNILSHVADVMDVAMASWTCRKWRLALRHHLHTLRLRGISKTEEFEFLLTNTILQTTSLQNLHISHNNRFAAAAVIAWLLHTGDSLRHLTYHVPESTLHVNVLERCARMKHLQSLDFSPNLTGYAFAASATAQWFPCLLSLTLSFIKVSASQLKSLVSACQMLESFFSAARLLPQRMRIGHYISQAPV
jgi:hypothetical protein